MKDSEHARPARRLVPIDIDLGDWTSLEPLFSELAEREIESVDALERWLLDRSELYSCVGEERSRRYVAMTSHTDDEDAERAYLHLLENVMPQLKPWAHRLNEYYLASEHRDGLPSERYEVLDRSTAAEIEIFREETVPLQTEASKLSQGYQKISGAMTVEFDGEERTLPQMAKVLDETDRDRRERAWRAVAERRLSDAEEVDGIFDELVSLRHRIAVNAGFEDFVGYAYKMHQRFDYGPAEAARFQETIEECVVPLARRRARHRGEMLGVETLRPWDMAVDPTGREPLRPFEGGGELTAGVGRILARLGPGLATSFSEMAARGDLDLESRKGKAPGGYMTTFDEIRRPFIFMNAAGVQRDVETLLHEFGHALHALDSADDPLLDYRHAPIEFAEVASMTMELFADDLLDEFYDPAAAARAKRIHLEGVLDLLPWIARIDAFQHWIYTNPEHDRAARTAEWMRLEDRFGPGVDWLGLEREAATSWQRQLHLFVHPFYYIEYGIAQLGALQIWRRFRVDPATALAGYRAGLALGGSRPLPELFETAGARFDFSAETLRPLVEAVEAELAGLPE